jgi:hypothetical protein
VTPIERTEPPSISGYVWAYHQIISILAGPAAQRRCLIGSSVGWCRIRTREEEIAFHEAGHVIGHHLGGDYVYCATIIPDERVRSGRHDRVAGGYVSASRVPVPAPREDSKLTEHIDCDLRRAVVLCALLSKQWPGCHWSAVLAISRTLREQARILIDQNWSQVQLIAGELLRYGRLDQRQIESLLKTGRPAAAVIQ